MIINKSKLSVMFFIGLVFPTACSSADENRGSDNSSKESTFSCGDYSNCTPEEFCLLEKYPSGEFNAERCAALPTSCASCDCAGQAAVEYFDGANNCDGLIECSISTGDITIECTNPGVGF